MNTLNIKKIGRKTYLATLTSIAALVFSAASWAGDASALLDDFSNTTRTSIGADRIIMADTTAGGGSSIDQKLTDGVLASVGEIVPARGQPGWVSMVLLTSPNGEAVDLSQYEGIRMRVRVGKGMLSVSANSSEVVNYDYHASIVPHTGDGIEEVFIPFKDMKRAWSEQTSLNSATIVSVSLVAVGMQKGSFDYDVDEVGFY